MRTITFTETDTFGVQSPVDAVEGETITFSCTFWGAATSPAVTAFRNRQTFTTTVFPTNSPTASGSVVTLSPAVFAASGHYVINVRATVDSSTRQRKFMVVVGRDEDEQ
jgi:hypothetical protein